MNNCCKVNLISLGAANCTFNFAAIKYIVFVDITNLEYDVNNLPMIGKAVIDGYAVVTPKLYNVTSEKPESTFQDFDDGTRFFIREGTRSITASIPKAIFPQLGALKKLRCKNNLGIYLVDSKLDTLGIGTEEPKFSPILISNESIDPIFQFATDTTVSQVNITLQFDSLIKEELLVVADNLFITDYVSSPVSIEAIVINDTLNTGSMKISTPNGAFQKLYINDLDFDTGISIFGKNLTSPGNFQAFIDITGYNDTTKTISFNITTLAGAATGDSVVPKRISGLKVPYAYSTVISAPTITVL